MKDDAPASRVWHPNTQMSEWEQFDSISYGDGVWLIDSEGRRMIDGVASMWCNVWGHSNAELVGAMTEQAQKLPHSSLFNLTHEPAEQLARSLVEMSPGMHRVQYSDSGSAAVEIALKMAFQYWTNEGDNSRCTVASLDRGYHGDTLGAMSVGQIPEFFSKYGRQMFKTVDLPVPVQTVTRGGCSPMDSERRQERCLGEISDTLSRRDDIAALIMESGAQMAGGARIFTSGFQGEVGRICRQNGVLLIVDEVATGFGRLGPMCVYSDEQSKPDIVTYGKMLTGGYLPLAATLATTKIYDAFLGRHDSGRHLFHGHTYSGNPTAAAVANKNLEMYARHNLICHITSKASKTLASHASGMSDIGVVGDVRHKGMMLGLELVADKESMKPVCPAASINHIIYKAGRRRGVYLRTLGNVVMVVPPLAISESELVMLLERTAGAIKDAAPALLHGR